MTIEGFWELIHEGQRDADDDCDQVAFNVTRKLENLEPSEILDFHEHLWSCIHRAYRYDLWAVAYIINGGCSDDGFTYFRGWLVTQGREFFEQVLLKPETAANRVNEAADETECEDILYAACDAYKDQTGEEIPQSQTTSPAKLSVEPEGKAWHEDDLEKLYPELCERFW